MPAGAKELMHLAANEETFQPEQEATVFEVTGQVGKRRALAGL